jgi:Parvulin-like peptidyl-prolyl isomerase
MILFAGLFLAPSSALVAQEKVIDADPVLVKTDKVEVRKSDFDAAILMLPEEQRTAFAVSEKRVIQMLSDLLRSKTLANEAKKTKLDQTPEAKAMVDVQTMRIYARLQREKLEKESEELFAKEKPVYEAKAKEIYLLNKKDYVKPAQVDASHILFDAHKYDMEEGLKQAQEVRAKIVSGEATFEDMVAKESDDPGSASKLGRLGWFSSSEMVPEFSEAAFALKEKGEISKPVLTKFGWHLIRLEDKKGEQPLSYEEAEPIIMAKLKRDFIDEQRAKKMVAIEDDPSAQLDQEAIDALVVRLPSPEEMEQKAKEGADAVQQGTP